MNICFRKIAADILGVRLMRQEIDSQQSVFKAEIQAEGGKCANNDGRGSAAVSRATGQSHSKSSMCNVS